MGRILHIRHPDIEYQPQSTLTAACLAAATSLSIVNSGGFTASKYLLLGGYNAPLSEIKLGGAISSVTAIATAATSFAHSAGEIVQQIPYNQIEIDYSTNLQTLWDTGLYASLSDAATAATWSSLTASLAITPNQEETIYKDDSTASRSYRWRYKNSTDTIYSDYVSIILPAGYEPKSMGSIIRNAISITNKEVSSDGTGQIYLEFLFDEATQCLQWVDTKRLHWSHNRASNSVLAEITAGTNQYILPSNIAVRESYNALENVQINDTYNLQYADKREMDVLTVNVKTSALAVALSSVSTTATFDDTSNFADDGTFDVWVSGTKMTVTYTANNRTTNVLTTPSCATEVTATAAIDTPVWQGATYGTPSYFTIYDGIITFDVVPSDLIHQRAITGDYYLKPQVVNSEDDYVRIENPNLVIAWLRKAISVKSGNDTNAAQYDKEMREYLKDMRFQNSTGQHQYLKPQITWPYHSNRVSTANRSTRYTAG